LTLVQYLRSDEIRHLEFIVCIITVYEENPCTLDKIIWQMNQNLSIMIF